MGVPFEVAIVSVALEVFGSSTLHFFLQVAAFLTLVFDFQVAFAPPGRPLTPSVTFFLKPLVRLTFTVKLVEPPAETLLLLLTESLKSGLALAAYTTRALEPRTARAVSSVRASLPLALLAVLVRRSIIVL